MKLFDYIKKRKIDKILMQYSKEYFDALNKNKEKLIEAFIIYYGEDYKDYIINRFKTIEFNTFISESTRIMIKYYIKRNSNINKKILKDLKIILSSKKYIGILSDLNSNFELDDESYRIFYNHLLFNRDTSACHGGTFDKTGNVCQFILCSLFSSDEELIHEINHALTEHPLATADGETHYLIEQKGIEVADPNSDIILEEVINDRATVDVCDIFTKQLNGNVSKYEDVAISSAYKRLFPLIEDFYQKYKSDINEARITGNKNVIYRRIDKRKYKELEGLIRESFEFMYDKEILEDYIKKAKRLTREMEKPFVEEDISSYIEELRKKGEVIKSLYSETENKKTPKQK